MIVQKFLTKRVSQSIIGRILTGTQHPKTTQQQWPNTSEPVRPTQSDKSRAAQFKITPEEFVRRDKIVRQLYIDCPWRIGDSARAFTEQGWKEYGLMKIIGIWKSYHDFPTAEAMDWPKDDKPLILTCMPYDTSKGMVLCASGYLRPKEQVLGGAC